MKFFFLAILISLQADANIIEEHFERREKKEKKEEKLKLTDSRKLKKLLQDVTNSEDAKSFLEKVTVKNMAKEFKNARSLSEANMIKFNGFYNGKIHFNDNRPSWTVKYELDAAYTRGKVVGSHLIEVYNEKMELLKSTTGTPNFYQYKMFGYQTPEVLLDGMQGDGIFQLYRPPRMSNNLVGLFYEKKGEAYEPVGYIELNRRN